MRATYRDLFSCKDTEAIYDYNQSLVLRPDHIDTLYDKAFAHLNLGEWDKADDLYDGILKIDQNYAGAMGDKSVVQALKGNFKVSLDFFNKALEIEPKNKRVLKNKELALKQYS